MNNRTTSLIAAAAGSLFALAASTQAQSTAFTYQGRLESGTNAANGTYDISFALYAASAGGNPIVSPETNVSVSVSNGLFTTTVDFGAVFNGSNTWLQIAVSTNHANSYSTLLPRQEVTPAPYAVYAETANASNLVGTIPTASVPGVALLAGGNAFTGNQTISGTVGIGTSSPFTQLANTPNNIYGSDGFGLGSQSLGWSSAAGGYTAGFYNPASGNAADGVVIKIAGNTARILELLSENTNSVLVAQGNGNVGIGTNAPLATLDVNGSGHFAGSVGIGANPGAPLDVRTASTPGAGSLISQFGSQSSPRIQLFDESLSSNAGPEIFFNAGNGAQIGSLGNIDLLPAGDVEIRNNGGRDLVMSGPGGGEWSFFDSTNDAFYWDVSGDANTFAISSSGIGYPFAINRNSGNVGINTTTPQHALDVNGNIFFGTERNGAVFNEIGDTIYIGAEQKYLGNTLLNPINGNTDWINLMANPLSGGIIFGLSGGSTTDPHSNVVPLMVIQSNGKVGIGTTTPAAGLDVELSASVSGGLWSFFQEGKISTNAFSGQPNLAIYTSGNIGASTYYAFSDARIKDIIGVSSGAQDLATLKNIRVTDFTYKDKAGKGSRPVKKVIAQQVESVYPQAVSKSTGVVPDIYAPATVKDGWIQLPTNLKKGESVKLISEQSEGIYKVLDVTANQFRTDCKTSSGKVFVFGRQVDDFRSVDYEALSMLNVSATQELARKLEVESAEVLALKEELAGMKKLVAQLAKDNKNASVAANTAAPALASASGQ